MAYAPMISLKQTVQRLLNSSRISILPHCPEIEEFAYKEIQSLQEVLKRLDSNSISSRERMNALDGQIREAVHKLEDVIESHVSNQFLSQSESHGDEGFSHIISLDSEEVRQEINSFAETVMKIKEEYIKELDNPLPEEEEDDAVSSRINFGGKKSKIVGLSYMISRTKKDILGLLFNPVTAVSLYGMAGIGKTTFAKEIFEDPLILSHFECRVWVTVGPKYQLRKMLLDILAQVDPENDTMRTAGNEKLEEYLCKCLNGRKSFFVLDDVWSKQVWDDLYMLFRKNGEALIGVLLTTRLKKVAYSTGLSYPREMHFLSTQASWHLLREKVFVEELCPPELEKAGKKIAQNCEGLPLAIVTVANLLSKAEKTPEYWNKVAEKKNSIFIDAYDLMSKVLLPSYNYLPQHLKACFLYMGVVPQNYTIPRYKLIKLWIAEGFLEPNQSQTVEDYAMECVEELVSNSLVWVFGTQTRTTTKVRTCHSAFWHLCIREAGKSKFFHVLNSLADCSAEGIKDQRRLSIYKNVLFSIEDVRNSMASISSVRSLLCAGRPHQYPVPINLGLRLLRILDALAIRFYEFPMAVLKQVQLRYLALTYDGNLPASISKLWILQFLIISRHRSIKSPRAQLYLPMEIWDMIELKHLEVIGSNLPDPNRDTLFPNLLTLSGVSAHSCTKAVVERIPNLKKLGIRIELEPDAVTPLCCFDHISHLHKLERLRCKIMNPKLRPDIVAPPVPLAIFPSSLKKLTLSGFGYPWEEMSKIALLPNLEELKLQCFAFQGPRWEIEYEGFLRLEVLLIEDTDLVHWIIKNDGKRFTSLGRLCLRHCYKLEEIPGISSFECVAQIQLFDCNPLAVLAAKQMQRDRKGIYGYLSVNDYSSWDDGKLKS